MSQVCHAVDRMGDTRVLFKSATAVRLCAAARVVHVGCLGLLRHPEIPSQREPASSVGKTPSFDFCQVDMYVRMRWSITQLKRSDAMTQPC